MKRLLILLLSLVMAFSVILTFAACGDSGDESSGETNGDNNSEQKPDEHKHEYVDGFCECGAEDPEYKPPHVHNFINGKCECGAEDPDYDASCTHLSGERIRENEISATCAKEGSYVEVVKCSLCGEELSKETKTIEKLPHTPKEAVRENEIPATCTSIGAYEEVIRCSVCETEISRTTKIEAKLEHNYVDGFCECGATDGTVVGCKHANVNIFTVNEIDPTCAKEGGFDEVTYCLDCGKITSTISNVIEKLPHTDVIDEAKAPTCTETGLTEGKHCSVCEEVLVAQTVVPATGHTEGAVVVENNIAPDCVNTGSYENVVYCTVCASELSREKITVPALGHTEVIDEAKAPTCTETGLTEGKHCSVCEEVLVAQTVVPATGHTEGAVVVENNIAPDCVNTGSYENVVYCTVCSVELSREKITVPALGHTEVIDEAKAPTCTETGLTEGKHCSVCEEVLVAQTVVPSTGHTAAEAVRENEIAATCAKEGSYDEVVYCSVCDAELSRTAKVIEKLPHRFVDGVCECGEFEIFVNPGSADGAIVSVSKDTLSLWEISEIAGNYSKQKVTFTSASEMLEYDMSNGYLDSIIYGDYALYINRYTGFAYYVDRKTGELSASNFVLSDASMIADTLLSQVVIAYSEKSTNSQFILNSFDAANSGQIKVEEGENGTIIVHYTLGMPDYTDAVPDAIFAEDMGEYILKPMFEKLALMLEEAFAEVGASFPEDPKKFSELKLSRFKGSDGNTYYLKSFNLWDYGEMADGTLNENRESLKYGGSFHGDMVKSSTRALDNYARKILGSRSEAYIEISKYISNICTMLTEYTLYNDQLLGLELKEETIAEWLENVPNAKNPDGSFKPVFVLDNPNTDHLRNSYLLIGRSIEDNFSSLPEAERFCAADAKELTEKTGSAVNSLMKTRFKLAIAYSILEDGEVCVTYPAEYFEYDKEKNKIESIEFFPNSIIGKLARVGDFSLVKEKGTWAVVGYSGSDEFVTIPAEHNGIPVTSIKKDAFAMSSVREIIIPDSVTSIGSYAFENCDSLTSVTIPNSVTSIGNYAFSSCDSLTSVTIGNSVTSIGSYAFAYCDSLTSVTIPDSVTSIGYEAFYSCDGLTSVTIPDSVTSISDGAFSGCYKLVEVINHSSLNIKAGSEDYGYVGYYAIEVHTGESKIVNYNDYLFYTYNGVNYLLGYVGEDKALVLPESYNGENYEIYKDAFCNRYDITSVVIPDSVTSIGNYAFEYCTSLTSVTIGNSVTSIGRDAFSCCNSLTSVTIGNSVTSIGSSAFSGCTSLTSVTIPDSVTSIGECAFSDCTGLMSVTIPDSVTSIGQGAFGYCDGLTSVTIGNGVTSIGSYAFSGCTGLTSVVIPNSVTSIGEGAFRYCTGLTSVTIPDSVTSIGYRAFYDCTGLMSVTIGNGVTSIGDYAFAWCTSLTSVTIGNSVTSIGSYAFKNCDSLTSVTIPNSVTSIGSSAFSGCTSLTSVTIPNSVTSIGNYAFSSCDSLTSVTIPNSVTSIDEGAFRYCYKLVEVINHSSLNIKAGSEDYGYVGYYAIEVHKGESKIVNYNDYLFYTYNGVNYLFGYVGEDKALVLPESYNGENYEIYQYAFDNRYDITSVVIPDRVTSIGDWAFSNCTGLTSVVIPNSVTSIGEGAFRYCTGLTSVTIPDSVTSIGNHAFEWCTGLTSVTIGNGVTSIGDYAFAYCDNLTSVTIPDSVVDIGDGAFYGCPFQPENQ